MVNVITQKQLREVRDLSFCHVCGKSFLTDDKTDHDHVPPQACFERSDRDPPLKLRTHVACNNANKLNDEKVGQLIAAQRRKAIDPAASRLRIEVLREDTSGKLYAGFDNLDVVGAIRRWIGGFHAALYGAPLTGETPYTITPPLPRARVSASGVVEYPIPSHYRLFVESLKLNRAAENLDVLITSNGKLRYECVWTPDDTGVNWLCIFALDIYDWIGLGDGKNFEARGCVGCYLAPAAGVPAGGTRATKLSAKFADEAPLNPFGK